MYKRQVVTQPDKPKGRGKKLQPTPVKAVALEHGIPVLQPVKVLSLIHICQQANRPSGCVEFHRQCNNRKHNGKGEEQNPQCHQCAAAAAENKPNQN